MESQEKGRYALRSIRDGIRAGAVAAKIAKYIGISIFGLLIVMVSALFIINDKTIEASGGPLARPALSLKHSILGAFTSATGTLVAEGNSKTPRVVQELPPPPTPATLATPVQTQSLSEIAADTQQEYARRDAAAAIPDSNESPEPSNAMSASEGSMPLTAQADSQNANAPPPPPAMEATEDTNSSLTEIEENEGSNAPLESAPLAPTNLTQVNPESEPDTSEMTLLESLDQEPSDDVAALPPETPDESENLESAVDDDPDPTGEQAYAEGLKYYSGEGVERNFGSAAQFFMKAAERGHPEAQYSLGLMNYVGQTGGQDFSNAAKWFQMAAESGHIQAQYNLGFLYYEGKGVQQDLKTAYGWIDRAAKQGYAKAVKARDALQKAMPEMFGS